MKTPKEKAKEIIQFFKYKSVCSNELVKKACLLCVNEIIHELKIDIRMDYIKFRYSFPEYIEDWNKVKTEIEKL